MISYARYCPDAPWAAGCPRESDLSLQENLKAAGGLQ
jgi:hypothetical protein